MWYWWGNAYPHPPYGFPHQYLGIGGEMHIRIQPNGFQGGTREGHRQGDTRGTTVAGEKTRSAGDRDDREQQHREIREYIQNK
jgi:hypothetical protein